MAAAGRQWFEIWVPQRAHLWKLPKVVFPDIAEAPRFFVDTDRHLVNGDCYWAATASLEEALLIAAIMRLARALHEGCGDRDAAEGELEVLIRRSLGFAESLAEWSRSRISVTTRSPSIAITPGRLIA